jgi:hypothetical protein
MRDGDVPHPEALSTITMPASHCERPGRASVKERSMPSRELTVGVLVGMLAFGLIGLPAAAQTPAKQPNILVIFGDDVGQTNISAYSFGLWATGRRTSTGSRTTA